MVDREVAAPASEDPSSGQASDATSLAQRAPEDHSGSSWLVSSRCRQPARAQLPAAAKGSVEPDHGVHSVRRREQRAEGFETPRYLGEVFEDPELVPTYAARQLSKAMPKHRLGEEGMSPRVAYQVIHDELRLDGFSLLNLATFVTTWMEPEAQQLIGETLDKNMIDRDEYPQTAEIERRCVNILSDLWHAPRSGEGVGTSTVGSSEACMLGGMALKWRWRDRQRAAGRPADRPNLVMGANTQVCWHKFCKYWDVEPREVAAEGDRFTLSAEEAAKLVDENTIGVVVILGSTFDGTYEPVAEVAKALDTVQEERGWDVPIHVPSTTTSCVWGATATAASTSPPRTWRSTSRARSARWSPSI